MFWYFSIDKQVRLVHRSENKVTISGDGAESNAATMTLHNKGTYQKQKTMFIYMNCVEVT